MPQILSIGPFVPYDGIDHAGGGYLLRHVRELSREYDVTLIAPDTVANQRAVQLPLEGVRCLLVQQSRFWRSPAMKVVRGLVNLGYGPTLGVDFDRRSLRDDSFIESVRNADIIELQWTESAGLSRNLRRIAPSTPQVLVAHDIISQKLDRRWRGTRRLLPRLSHWARWVAWSRAERRILRSVDRVVVFSEKDAEIARQITGEARLSVLHPALDEAAMPASLPIPSDQPVVLFTAAFDRAENAEGAIWLLNEVWPSVIASLPDARLVLAGAGPPTAVVAAAQASGVELTGYVESFDGYYSIARVAVVPVLRGAGVKFKSIIAMLWGVSVVSTPVGAEGVGDSRHYAAITSDPREFSDAIVRVLTDPATVETARSAAFDLAHFTYSSKHFAGAIQEIYSQLRVRAGRT